MITKEILLSHPVSVLKKEISKTNIKGYSKMRKLELIELMMKPEHTKRFGHIKMGASYIPGDLKPLSKAKKEPVKKDKKIGIKRTPKPAPKPAPVKFSLPFPPKSTSGKPSPKFNDKNSFTPTQVSMMSTQTLKENLNLFIEFSKYYTKDEILFYKELKDRGAKIPKAVEKKYKLTISKNDKGEAKTPKPTPAPAKKTEPPKEKLIQFSEDDSLDRRTLFNNKIINSVNRERFKSGRPQYKTVQAYEKEALERRNKEAAEKRARTRARNQKKKQEETKTTTSNKTKDQFINEFMTSNINDLGFLGNERLTNIIKIINASSDKGGKYKFFYTTDFLKVLGYDVVEKLFFKYGVMPTFERIKKMVLKVNPNKKVNIPARNNVTLKGFPTKLQNTILITLDKEKFNPILSKLLDKIKTISDLEKIKKEGQKEINKIDKNLILKTEYRKPKTGIRPSVTVFLESITNKIIASQSIDKLLQEKKKVIKVNKEISKTPEGYMNPDRLIGEGLKLLMSNNKDQKKRGVKQIKIIKSGTYLSDSKGVRSPNYTLEKFVGGSFRIKSHMNNIFKEYLFNEKGESI